MVVMSIDQYEKQQALIRLYKKLGKTENESKKNASKTSHSELMGKIKAEINLW